jgi:hypothetical protein
MGLQDEVLFPQFPYTKEQVRFNYEQENGFHVIAIFVEEELVNKRLFLTAEEVQTQLHNLELAIRLGATFNDEGYWEFEYPPRKKRELHDQFFRLAKG